MAVLGLRFCARAFSTCGKRGPLFMAVRGPLMIAASLVAEHRLQTRRLSSCGSRAQLLRRMWDLPRPGLEPVSPALAGRFSTTAPPGKPPSFIIISSLNCRYLEVYCLIPKQFWILYFSVTDSQFNSTVINEYSLYFIPLKFVETSNICYCFMISVSCILKESMQSAVVGCSVLYMSMKLSWLIVLFVSSATLLISLFACSVIRRDM